MLRKTFLRTGAPKVWQRGVAQLTAEHYQLKRKNYGKLEPKDIEYFKSILPASGVIQDAEDLEIYNTDWMNKYRGQSRLVLRPASTDQVSKIMKHCYERNLAVVPQSGNTGLVGGSVPVFDEIVVSLSSMNKVREFHPSSGIIEADAGIILQNLDEFLNEKGFIFPLDLGSKGSCEIGGNASTNAGGLRLLRYGNLHGSILGVEAVMANGEVFDGLTTLRKDNAGYDLKQLFIGSEGTLGIITGLSVICPPKPKAVNVAFLGLKNFEDVQKVFVKTRSALGEILSSYECMDKASLDLAALHCDLPKPLEEIHPFNVLIETSGSDQGHDEEKLTNFLESIMEEGLVDDGVLAQDETQIQHLWYWREFVPEATTKEGGVYKYDVSLPLPVMFDLVDAVRERLNARNLVGEGKPVIAAIGYGHIGDSNLHLNVACRGYFTEVEETLEPFVYEFVQKHRGSISAEHGVGFQKAHAVHYSRSPIAIKMMKELKNLYDPKGILNPYKYIQE